jgi:hypothetical protein
MMDAPILSLSPAILSSNKVKQHKKKSTFNPRRYVCIPSNSMLAAFPKVCNELHLHQQLYDGIFRNSDERALYIRRIILSAASPYSKALLTNNLKRDEPEINKVNLSMTGHILDLILDYAYTDHSNVTLEDVGQLLSVDD